MIRFDEILLECFKNSLKIMKKRDRSCGRFTCEGPVELVQRVVSSRDRLMIVAFDSDFRRPGRFQFWPTHHAPQKINCNEGEIHHHNIT